MTREVARARLDLELASLHEERHPDGPAPGLDDGHGLGRLRRRERRAAPDDPGLLARDVREPPAEELLVVVVDPRHHRHQRAPHVGRVAAAAEPHLEHGRVDPGLRESAASATAVIASKNVAAPASSAGSIRARVAGEGLLGHRRPSIRTRSVTCEEMGRGVEARPESRGLEDGRRQRGDRALPVGPADVDDAEPGLGAAERGEQRLDAVEPEPHPGALPAREAEEPLERGGHGTGGSTGSAKNARRRRRRSREILPLDDAVDHPVLEEELSALEALAAAAGGWSPRSRAGPAKPISAFGSARMRVAQHGERRRRPRRSSDPRAAREYGTRSSASRPSAADVFAICISDSMPSCIRAPPEHVTMRSGMRLRVASSIARVIFSPTTGRHAAAHERELEDAHDDRVPVDPADAGDQGVLAAGLPADDWRRSA